MDNANQNTKTDTSFKKAIIVTSDSTPISCDKLNHFYFAVTIKTNKYTSDKGAYTVDAHYGPDDAEGGFSMPKGGEHLKPLLRKGKKPYTYIIGFKWHNDTTFYDYFLISAMRDQINMRYLNSYTFQ